MTFVGHQKPTNKEWLNKSLRYITTLPNGDEVWERPTFFNRPPIGKPLAGRRATLAGRSKRRQVSKQAQLERQRMAYRAYVLRTRDALTLEQIAAELCVGMTTIARWLRGVPRGSTLEEAPQQYIIRHGVDVEIVEVSTQQPTTGDELSPD